MCLGSARLFAENCQWIGSDCSCQVDISRRRHGYSAAAVSLAIAGQLDSESEAAEQRAAGPNHECQASESRPWVGRILVSYWQCHGAQLEVGKLPGLPGRLGGSFQPALRSRSQG